MDGNRPQKQHTVGSQGFGQVELSELLQGATSAPKALCGKGFTLPPSSGNLELIDNKTEKIGTAVPVIAYIW